MPTAFAPVADILVSALERADRTLNQPNSQLPAKLDRHRSAHFRREGWRTQTSDGLSVDVGTCWE